MTKTFNDLPWIVKVVLQILFGWFGSGLYRIFKFLEKKNLITLIAGILMLFTGVGNIIGWIVDLYTLITKDKITFLAD